jgi:citrate lyase beta subunit
MPEPPVYLGIRSIMETHLLDDRKWAKIPDIPADAIFIDLEDSLPPPRKDEGRARAVKVLAQPEFDYDKALKVRQRAYAVASVAAGVKS